MLEVGPVNLVERLREVLRRNYRETCRNCERLFTLADLCHDHVDGRCRYRVTCQDCGEMLATTNKDNCDGDWVSNFIEVLGEDLDADR